MRLGRKYIVKLDGWEYRRYWRLRNAERAILRAKWKHDISKFELITLR